MDGSRHILLAPPSGPLRPGWGRPHRQVMRFALTQEYAVVTPLPMGFILVRRVDGSVLRLSEERPGSQTPAQGVCVRGIPVKRIVKEEGSP
jgi:hypothetical protein